MNFSRIDESSARVVGNLECTGDASEVSTLPQRHIQQDAPAPPHLLNGGDQRRKIDVVCIHAVDDDHPCQSLLSRFVEDTPGVDFDARLSVDHDDRVIDAGQRTDRLTDEVRVAGGVEGMKELAAVAEMSERRFDRVLVLLFLRIEIADARLIIDTRVGVDRSGRHEHLVDERRLAGRTVPAKRDVANVRHLCFCHRWVPSFWICQ